MKTIYFLLVSSTMPIFATGIPVVDAAHIAVNEVSHTMDFAEQLVHEANQQTQIAKEIEQIKQLYEQIEQLYQQIEQMDDYLARFGDPKQIVDLAGLDALLKELGQKTTGLDIEKRLPAITGEGMFGFDGVGVLEAITPSFEVGGQVIEREPERYKAEDATRATIEEFRRKKQQVIERRDQLKGEIAETTKQLQTASTDSEVQKLTGVMLGLQTELEAMDQEVEIAAAENQARELENTNQRRAQAKAAAERDAKRFQIGNQRDLQTYKIDRGGYGW